ncbi:dynamin family protein [Azonexus sp.]|uniref:dynamin family protein n=1 Tax=Azonexus sp. TaxID=1872668 RepID=UPI0027BA9A04|nr:dynamin family protein [Azonexus sp.]
MFKQQKIILEYVPNLQRILKKYQWKSTPENWLEVAQEKSRNFSVILPFVGAFSAGKSTLLNALIETHLFPTNIDPETAYPAELSYGTNETISGHLPGGKVIPLSREDLQHNLPAMLPKGSHVTVSLTNPLLDKLPHLRLVDMPGWDSGIEAHAAAIDGYAARSLAYCVVVSAEEGNLRESLRRALRELAVSDMPILAVISKADKKTPEDVDAVVEQVRQEITDTMGRPPLSIVKVSARKKQFSELIAALEQLEQQAEQIFSRNVSQSILTKLGSFNAHLDTLINSDDLDSEKVQAQCERLHADMASFEVRLNDETQQLETRVQPVLGRIVDRIGNALREDIESLTSDAMNGGDLSGNLGSTVRLAAQTGITSEFTPEIERYLNRVVEGLPDNFSPEINCSFDYRAESKGEKQPLIITPILTMLQPLLKLDPRLKIISTVVLGIVGLLESLFNNAKQKEVDEVRQRESVRQKIAGTVIPDTLRQVQATLLPMLEEHIQSAKQKIADTVRVQQASHEAALRELQAKLAEGRAVFEAARTQYQADRVVVSRCIVDLEKAR